LLLVVNFRIYQVWPSSLHWFTSQLSSCVLIGSMLQLG